MLMPFEWVVGDSSKDHTVTASMFYDVLATVRYTTLRGITRAGVLGRSAPGQGRCGLDREPPRASRERDQARQRRYAQDPRRGGQSERRALGIGAR